MKYGTVVEGEFKFRPNRFVAHVTIEGKEEIVHVKNTSRCRELLIEGVTLENQGILRFPDAPTERGLKHIHELIKAKREGYLAYILFLIQMKGALYFEPNDIMHPAFGAALRMAQERGVHILAYDSFVSEDEITFGKQVEVRL